MLVSPQVLAVSCFQATHIQANHFSWRLPTQKKEREPTKKHISDPSASWFFSFSLPWLALSWLTRLGPRASSCTWRFSRPSLSCRFSSSSRGERASKRASEPDGWVRVSKAGSLGWGNQISRGRGVKTGQKGEKGGKEGINTLRGRFQFGCFTTSQKGGGCHHFVLPGLR